MIFNLSGGGAALNFRVVGGVTQPSGPKENTIWVNTDQKITSWFFAHAAPEEPEEGMVWIRLGSTGSVELNALKKNGIQLYPVTANQYIGNAWQVCIAQIWQDGGWNLWWDGTLYSAGDEFTHITGGWEAAWTSGDYYNTKGTVTKNEASLKLNASTATSSIFAKTVNKIDVTDYDTLSAMATAAKGKFGLSSGEAWNTGSNMAASATPANGEATLDISEMTGEYYICMYIAAGSSIEYSEVKLS